MMEKSGQNVTRITVSPTAGDGANEDKMKVIVESQRRRDKAIHHMANAGELTRNEMTGILFFKQWAEFAEVVSIVGIRYAVIPTASVARKVFWTLLVLFGIGFVMYQVQNRISYYISWPTTVNLEVKYNNTLRFPTVTICNENEMRRAATDKLGKYRFHLGFVITVALLYVFACMFVSLYIYIYIYIYVCVRAGMHVCQKCSLSYITA